VPSEISIVDRPCCPTAKFHNVRKRFEFKKPGFDLHKRDGSRTRVLTSSAQIRTVQELRDAMLARA